MYGVKELILFFVMHVPAGYSDMTCTEPTYSSENSSFEISCTARGRSSRIEYKYCVIRHQQKYCRIVGKWSSSSGKYIDFVKECSPTLEGRVSFTTSRYECKALVENVGVGDMGQWSMSLTGLYKLWQSKSFFINATEIDVQQDDGPNKAQPYIPITRGKTSIVDKLQIINKLTLSVKIVLSGRNMLALETYRTLPTF